MRVRFCVGVTKQSKLGIQIPCLIPIVNLQTVILYIQVLLTFSATMCQVTAQRAGTNIGTCILHTEICHVPFFSNNFTCILFLRQITQVVLTNFML